MRLVLNVLLAAVVALAEDRLSQAQPNAPRHRDTPYVLLIGLDGFRWDFAKKFGAKNLLAFRDRGSSAAGLLPSFPSTTFPNFYTLVTGLRPDKHGLVGMHFREPSTGEEFSYRENATEPKWFEGATPLWNLAENAGMRTASYFWVGSEAPIRGSQPSAWFNYDAKVPHEQRIGKVLEWLNLPIERRPHFITLYFADVDTAGHQTGIDSTEMRQAVLQMDEVVGQLLRGLQRVRPAVNVIIVSDHGLATMSRVIDLTGLADFTGVHVVNTTTKIALYSEDKARLQRIKESLGKKNDGSFAVYWRQDLPGHLNYRTNPRNGDLLILSTGTHGIGIRSSEEVARRMASLKLPVGTHGYDVRRVPEMKGIFYAAGPSIRPGVRLGELENTSIFALMARILRIEIPAGADTGRELIRRLSAVPPTPAPESK